MNGFLGCDKDSILALLTSKTKVERQEIAKTFQKMEEKVSIL